MNSSPNHSDDSPAPPKPSTVVFLLREIADTTWRMFVPTIGLTLIGVWLDKTYATYPVFVIVGIIIGVIVTGLLMRQQFKRIT